MISSAATGGAANGDTLKLFSGGVTNSGSITAASGIGIRDNRASTFLGGITNTGTITAGHAGIEALSLAVGTFGGGITNTGTIAGTAGIIVSNFSNFSGDIANSGTINASAPGIFCGCRNCHRKPEQRRHDHRPKLGH